MALERRFWFICDNCGATSEMFDGVRERFTDAIAWIKQLGWSRRIGGKFEVPTYMCTNCNPNHKQGATR